MDERSHVTAEMPASIGRYKVLEVVGFGAMGAVYRAIDPVIKRTLAIKTIRLDIPRQSPQYRSFIDRFWKEAEISGTLSHPNIVTLFDVAMEGGTPFLAMEFVEGETVGSLIEKGHRFKPEKVISLVSQVAAALDYAHSKGIIHRDIKPANLMLYDGDKIKVMDFGIAKGVDAEMTQSGTLLGTPSYMSPEQAMGDKLDGRTDIFSLGVCAFEMLSGEQPFPGNNVTSILYKLVHVDPIEPANLEMNGLVPQKWHEVFGKVLAKKPVERYQTAAEFVHDLEFCLGSWFGSLEDTIVTGPAGDETATLPRMAVPRPTAPPPAPPPAAPPIATDPTLVPGRVPPPRPGAATSSSLAATADGSTTVVVRSPPATGASSEEATVVFRKPPVVEPAEEATVVFKAPPPVTPPPVVAPPARGRAPQPPAEEESASTVVLKGPSARARETHDTATIVMKAPRPPPPRAEPTVIMTPGTSPVTRASRPTPASDVPTIRVPAAMETQPPVPRSPAAAQTAEFVNPAVPEETRAAAAPARTRPGVSPRTLLLGAGALFVIALVAVGAVLLRQSREETTATATTAPPPPSVAPPTTTMAPVAVTGSLYVETDPAGAAVSVNGETQGSSPLDLADVPLGAYEVKVELKGYEPRTESLSLTEAAPRGEVKVALTKAAPTTGLADIVSTPFGATVMVDGAKVGLTPVTGYRLKPGNHQVDVSREGYEPWRGTLLVQAGQRSRLDASLRSTAKAAPTPPPVEAVDTSRVHPNTPDEVDTVARKTAGSTIAYPDAAPRLRSGASVSVSVTFVVNENGEVMDARVVESGGKVLDETVLSAVRKWKYSPATKRGTKVKVQTTFRQTFRAE
jgi:TonB family protein